VALEARVQVPTAVAELAQLLVFLRCPPSMLLGPPERSAASARG
jgi:hypothetical protein